ncbi:MAG TPA: hypothetical protein VH559_12000 [Gemmatimonadaceae bacterium]|jgi:hypothetical protein
MARSDDDTVLVIGLSGRKVERREEDRRGGESGEHKATRTP